MSIELIIALASGSFALAGTYFGYRLNRQERLASFRAEQLTAAYTDFIRLSMECFDHKTESNLREMLVASERLCLFAPSSVCAAVNDLTTAIQSSITAEEYGNLVFRLRVLFQEVYQKTIR